MTSLMCLVVERKW